MAIMTKLATKSCRMSTMLVLTLAFFLLEVIFGYITNSMALIADSFHMLSDVLALIIAFACLKISKRRISARNTFGWVRAEVLGALINTVFLVALSFSIILESIQRLFEPQHILYADKVLIVGAAGLVVNIIGLFLFHGHGGHGHSHGGGGGGHGHSHGGGRKHDDHGESGHGHSHGGHGHSHSRVVPYVDINGVSNLPNAAYEDCNHDDDHDHDHDHDHHHNSSNDSDRSVECVDQVLDKRTTVAIMRVRRQSSKYNVRAEELTDNPEPVVLDTNATPNGGKKKLSHATQLNMHGIWLHVLGDAFGSIVVIVNAIVNWKVDVPFLRNYLDPMLSLLMSAIIMGSSIPLLKESAMILLQTVPTHINVAEIKKKLIEKFGRSIIAVHEFHVWRLTGNKIVATAHVLCRGDLDDYMRLAEKLKEFFHDEGIHSTTIQPELTGNGYSNSSGDQCTLKCPKKHKSDARHCADDACCLVPPTPATDVMTTNPLAMAAAKSNGVVFSFSASQLASSVPSTPRIEEESRTDNDNHL